MEFRKGQVPVSQINNEFSIDYTTSQKTEIIMGILRMKDRLTQVTNQLNKIIRKNQKSLTLPKTESFQSRFLDALRKQKENTSKILLQTQLQIEKLRMKQDYMNKRPQIFQIQENIKLTKAKIDHTQRYIKKISLTIKLSDNDNLNFDEYFREQSQKIRQVKSEIFKAQNDRKRYIQLKQQLDQKIQQTNQKNQQIEQYYNRMANQVVRKRVNISPNYKLMKTTQKYELLKTKLLNLKKQIFMVSHNMKKKYQICVRQRRQWQKAYVKIQSYIKQCLNSSLELKGSLNKLVKKSYRSKKFMLIQSLMSKYESNTYQSDSQRKTIVKKQENMQHISSIQVKKLQVSQQTLVQVQPHRSLQVSSFQTNKSEENHLPEVLSSKKLKKRRKIQHNQDNRSKSHRSQEIPYEEIIYQQCKNQFLNPQLFKNQFQVGQMNKLFKSIRESKKQKIIRHNQSSKTHKQSFASSISDEDLLY